MYSRHMPQEHTQLARTIMICLLIYPRKAHLYTRRSTWSERLNTGQTVKAVGLRELQIEVIVTL